MITIWKQNGKGIVQTALPEPNCWVQVCEPTTFEVETLQRDYRLPSDLISDILDVDERSRTEKEDEYLLLIIRVPVFNARNEVPYFTIPLGVILLDDKIITISLRDNQVVRDFTDSRVRNLDLANKSSFILHLFDRSSTWYLRHLKEINRQTTLIESDLARSIKNNELVSLLTMEKSLVYFTTSLKSNELLLEKLNRPSLIRLDETEADLLEDAIIETKQAIEMANIYSNILSGMMDAFASVISNNLNQVMKQLTSISIVLMIPTLIASVYGMNVALPGQGSPLAFLGVVVLSVVTSIFGGFFFMRKRFF